MNCDDLLECWFDSYNFVQSTFILVLKSFCNYLKIKYKLLTAVCITYAMQS